MLDLRYDTCLWDWVLRCLDLFLIISFRRTISDIKQGSVDQLDGQEVRDDQDDDRGEVEVVHDDDDFLVEGDHSVEDERAGDGRRLLYYFVLFFCFSYFFFLVDFS